MKRPSKLPLFFIHATEKEKTEKALHVFSCEASNKEFTKLCDEGRLVQNKTLISGALKTLENQKHRDVRSLQNSAPDTKHHSAESILFLFRVCRRQRTSPSDRGDKQASELQIPHERVFRFTALRCVFTRAVVSFGGVEKRTCDGGSVITRPRYANRGGSADLAKGLSVSHLKPSFPRLNIHQSRTQTEMKRPHCSRRRRRRRLVRVMHILMTRTIHLE